jgi:flavin-binding protein dodecin
MSVAKIIEISSTSKKGFQDAIDKGVTRASKTVKNIAGAWVKEQHVMVEGGKVTGYRVNLMVTFILDGKDDG